MRYTRFLRYFIKFKWTFLIGVVFVILSTLAKTYSPRLVQKLIDEILGNLSKGVHAEAIINPLVIKFVVLFIALTLISALFTFLMRQTIIVASRKIEFELKNDLFNHIQKLQTEEFKNYTVGDLMSRIGEDIGKIREVYGPALMYTINLVTTLSITIYFMLSVNGELTFWSLLPLPFLSLFVYVYNMYSYKFNTKLQQNLSALTSLAQESYNGIRIIKSFTLEKKIFNQFSNLSEDFKNQNLQIVKVDSLFMPISTFLMSLSILITVFVGGQLYFQHKITIGNLTEFIMYVNNLTWPIMSIGWVANLVQRGKASITRYEEIMNLSEEVQSVSYAPNKPLDTSIRFENVSYVYPDTGIKAVDNVSFEIKQGERWLIVGKTGCGKSTLAELLMKYYTNYSGKIYLGNEELHSISTDQLRSTISYIPQEVFLFSDTVRNNIAFSDSNFPQENVQKAADSAQIHTEITGFKDGYNTIVGERGITLSGGQKQRISIARALIKPSPIYLFDDCLSAVDVETEKNLIQAINEEGTAQKTMIMITHRIFNQLKFDKIIVLNNGGIEELGSHDELMAQKGYYHDLYKKQELRQTVERETA